MATLSSLIRHFALAIMALSFSRSTMTAEALVCYENNNEGDIYEVSNASWTYCALIPPINPAQDGVRLFGLGPHSEHLDTYDQSFAQSSAFYKILSVCILEKYDLSSLSRFPFPELKEFMFRCVCNFDRCNSATTFAGYLHTIQKKNMDSKSVIDYRRK